MSVASSFLSALASGLLSGSPNSRAPLSILSAGITQAQPPRVSTPNANETVPGAIQQQPATDAQALASGNQLVTQMPAPVDRGFDQVSTTDPTSLLSKLTPSIRPKSSNLQTSYLPGDVTLYTGSDIRLMIEVADPLGPVRWAKELIECSTITISIHRVKDPARACGYIGAKGYSRGSRTIAGTIVLTELGKDVLFEFLQAFALRDKSKDSQIVKVDQIPPLNITMLFTNEAGYASMRRVTGIDLATDGTVYSINDAYSERTISYIASDFTPLMPISIQSLINPQTGFSSGSTSREASPIDLMQPPALTTLFQEEPLVSYQ